MNSPFWLATVVYPVQFSNLNEVLSGFFLLYIGPETIIPLTSFLAAIAGVFLMFWRWIVGTFLRIVNRITGRKNEVTNVEAPSEVSGNEQELESGLMTNPQTVKVKHESK